MKKIELCTNKLTFHVTLYYNEFFITYSDLLKEIRLKKIKKTNYNFKIYFKSVIERHSQTKNKQIQNF